MSVAIQVKKNWIIERINEYKRYIEEMQCKIVRIFGTPYILNVNYQNIKNIEINLEEREIDVVLPSKYRKVNQDKILNSLVEKVYEQIAHKEIEQIMEKTRVMLKIAPENYKILKSNKLISKCQNEIIINPEIVKYKKEVVEYIIAHQFCHLKYKTHSKRFYEMLNRNFKNNVELQKYIERNGIRF